MLQYYICLGIVLTVILVLVLVLGLGIILYFVISLLLRYQKASKCKSRHYKLLPHATVIVLASTSNNSLVRQAHSGHKSSKRDQYVLSSSVIV